MGGFLIPIENERKFVLRPPYGELERQIADIACRPYEIEQAYLCKNKKFSVRIRSTVDKTNKDFWYQMTVKRSVRGECVEIETEIEEPDFAKLWSISSGRLRKTRYLVSSWEIDFFKDKHNNNYFAQAEIELPRGVDYPSELLPIIQDNLLYKVLKGDDRFASKKLCDIHYTNKILHMLLEKKSNER